MEPDSGPVTVLASWEGRTAAEWAVRLGVAAAEFHSRIGSTSDRARRLAGDGGGLPAIVVADRQLQGRGRQGRRWVSDSSRGLWFTAVHEADRIGVEVLPLRVGLAVALALESVVPSVRIGVKWPNDLVAAGRKLGGILCERVPGAVLIGVGLNLNHLPDELSAVTPAATSLRLECGHEVSRAAVLASAAQRLGQLCADPAAVIPAPELEVLNARSPLNGRPLSVSGVVRDSTRGPNATRNPRAVEEFAATAEGLLPDGSLEVRDRAGKRWRLIAGTVQSWS